MEKGRKKRWKFRCFWINDSLAMTKEVFTETENQLVGRCPICPDPSGYTGSNQAYVDPNFGDETSDLEKNLFWSIYYELYVCRLCNIQGQDLSVDVIRDWDDREKDKDRQKMGFRQTYVTN